MKVLIMEDEIQIREGLMSEVSWSKYGVQEIYTARNGEIGFEMAKKYLPEIILTDIRMPKMDGISAVKKLKEILPNSSIIFISAYPEKDYFKEAIRLKAVSFIEKPIDMQELDKVLLEASLEQQKYLHEKEQKRMADMYTCQQLANRLSRKEFANKEECRKCLKEVGIDGDSYSVFVSVIVLHTKNENGDDFLWSQFCYKIVQKMGMAPAKILVGLGQSPKIICHVFMRRREQLEGVIEWLSELLKDIPRCNLLVGSEQNTYMKFGDSYNDAALLLNKVFYSEYGEVVRDSSETIVFAIDFASWKNEFTECLTKKDTAMLLKLLAQYKEQILLNRGMLHSRVREFYMFMCGELIRQAEKNSLVFQEEMVIQLQDKILRNSNYGEIHAEIEQLIGKVLNTVNGEEDEQIVYMKKYILANYQNPWLSIKEVADAVGKSVSYACVMFKKATGITLNQYLTEVRMEASKVYLANPKHNVKTVAEKCGYADSSYYARAFKKYTGIKPSDYREEGK